MTDWKLAYVTPDIDVSVHEEERWVQLHREIDGCECWHPMSFKEARELADALIYLTSPLTETQESALLSLQSTFAAHAERYPPTETT